jgi:hypothetical protein
MRSPLALLFLASLTIAFVLAGAFTARADEPKDSKEVKTDKLGRNWEKVRDSLDEAFETMQADAGIAPAPLADDGTWLRRIYLDLTGAPPSLEEIKAFNPSDKDPGRSHGQRKREELAERLIRSIAFEEHFAGWIATALVGRGSADFPNFGRAGLQAYLQDSIERNRPWNEVVYAMFAGETQNRAFLNYLISSNDLGYVAGTTARVFLGRQIQCAQCHDSKIDDTKQADFEAWQAFFKTFTREYVVEGETRLLMDEDMRYGTVGELQKKLDLKGEHKLPRFLDGKIWTTRDGRTLREAMAAWLTGKNNPWFAEMTVNRLMAYFLGVGFVNPVDDFNGLNEPTIPLILKVMGMDFAASGYDLRYLVKAIVTSRIYQRESTTNHSNMHDRVYYSHQHVRELSADSVARSIIKVLDLPRLNPERVQRQAAGPQGGGGGGAARPVVIDPNAPETLFAYQARLQTLIDNAWDSDDSTKTVDERGGNIARALMFLNGEILPRGMKTSLTELLDEPMSTKARVEAIFTTVMGRYPNEVELEQLVATVKEWANGQRLEKEIYEDLFIALMCTPEFINRT